MTSEPVGQVDAPPPVGGGTWPGLVPPPPGALPVAAVPAGAMLVTDDVVGSASFYRALLGWWFEEAPEPGGLVAIDVADVRTALLMPAGAGPCGWLPLFFADEASVHERARARGGDVVHEHAWSSVLVDPHGARLGLVGAGALGAATCSPEAVSIVDIGVLDVGDAVDFYGHVMGWGLLPVLDHGYNLLTADQVPAAGIWEPTGTFTSTLWPPDSGGWQVYLRVDDGERATAMAMELGGRLSVPPTDSPVGVFANLVDPQGLPFGVAERNSDESRLAASLSWKPAVLSRP